MNLLNLLQGSEEESEEVEVSLDSPLIRSARGAFRPSGSNIEEEEAGEEGEMEGV